MRLKKWVKVTLFILAAFICAFILFSLLKKPKAVKEMKDAYIKGNSNVVSLYNEEFQEVTTIPRGSKVSFKEKLIKNETTNTEYNEIIYENKK